MEEEKKKDKPVEINVEEEGFQEHVDPDSGEFMEPQEPDKVEEFTNKVKVGDKETDVYTEEGREILTEGDEMKPWEEGFSQGAANKGHLGVCARCGKILSDEEDKVVEKEFNREMRRFCCDKCAQAGPDPANENK